MLFTENEWYLINSIILDIHQSCDNQEMRKGFLKRVRFLIPYDKANFFLSSSDEQHYITDSVDVGFPKEYLHDYFGNLEEHDFMNWIYASGQNEVFLLSELLSAQEQKENIYFKNYFCPNEIEYAVILSLAWHGSHVGTLSLFRSRTSENFTVRDKQALNLFKNHLALYLHKSLSGNYQSAAKLAVKIEEITDTYRLTPRESEILSLLIEDNDLPCICQQLFISDNTFENIFQIFIRNSE